MSNNSVIKIGMVGCGDHSHIHAKAAKSVNRIRLISCCDINELTAKKWAETYNCQNYYTSLEEMLKNEELDAVILCTWPKQHLEQIKKCLSLGIKNILCEKSLALSSQESFEIWNLIKKENAFLMEACMYRHHPAIHKLERILSYKDIGNIDSIRATFSNYEPEDTSIPVSSLNWRERNECGGGVPYDWMSYLVNACNHFSNSTPLRVYAKGNVSERLNVIYRIHGMIEYENGVVAFIESSKEANFSEELQITCSLGTLKLPVAWGIYGDVTITQEHRKQDWDYILKDTYEIEDINAFALQLKNFSDVIISNVKPIMPLDESIINVHTIDALVQSVLENRLVEVNIPKLH